MLLHIKHAYLQRYCWLRVSFVEDIALNGYTIDKDDNCSPDIVNGNSIGPDFPIPCNCPHRVVHPRAKELEFGVMLYVKIY